MTKLKTITLTLYSITHFLVDFACIYMVHRILNLNYPFWAGDEMTRAGIGVNEILGLYDKNWLLLIIPIYNILAFGLQAPLGFVLDKLKIFKISLVLSISMIAVSLFINENNPLIAILFAGLGNAIFHITGGSFSLSEFKKPLISSAVFVGPGALGVTLGVIFGSGNINLSVVLATLLIIFSTLIFQYDKNRSVSNEPTSLNMPKKHKALVTIVLSVLILSVVASRAFVGTNVYLPWKKEGILLLIFTAFIVIGKMISGLVAQKTGWIRSSILGLLIALPLLSFANEIPILAITGAFFFQMSMPVTLVAIYKLFPKNPAFSFGLPCLALLLGAIPMLSRSNQVFSNPFFIFSVTIFSAIVLFNSLTVLDYLKVKIIKNSD